MGAFAWLLVIWARTFGWRTLCYGFVLMSHPASAGTVRLLEPGTSSHYKLSSELLLNEAGSKGKNVGYLITADITVGVVWQNAQVREDKLLMLEMNSPKLQIKSREVPTPEGFIPHKSDLDNYVNIPFFAHWNSGTIVDIYISKDEDVSLTNIKKGIASSFQFQMYDLETNETDVSGRCNVVYHIEDSSTFVKTKNNCISELLYIKHPEETLSTTVNSKREMRFTLSRDGSELGKIASEELHELILNVKKDAGSSVSTKQELLLEGSSGSVELLSAKNIVDAIQQAEKKYKKEFNKQTLMLNIYTPNCEKEDCPSLPTLIKENREILAQDHLGTVKSASVFIKLLAAARYAQKDELAKAFKGTKNKEILAQLCDLAGAVQTLESHHVMMKLINVDSDEDQDVVERYLWALSQGSHPLPEVLNDIYKLNEKPHTNEKVSETILLTLAAMTLKFRKLPGNENHKLVNAIVHSIIQSFDLCKDESCKHKYFRAFRNLNHIKTVPILLENALNGKKKTSVFAMTTLKSLSPEYWDSKVIDAAQRIFYQVGKKYDSSARTLAVDILLESRPSYNILKELIFTLTLKDPVYEVKQYLHQRIRQIAQKDLKFATEVAKIYKEYYDRFNNYDQKALRGLTTAFTRRFMSGSSVNGSISTVQEINSGLLKRGVVDIILDTESSSHTLFSLGLFAGGLGAFVSSNKENEDENDVEEEESATAGMNVNVAGVEIRPFVFFNGQGELMGHVWSGTASDKTPAFQSFILLLDHFEYIPLQSGILAKLQVYGIVSFDLSGQVQMSIWNRNAHTLVEINAGTALQGRIHADTSFVKSQVEYNVGAEGKVHLESDIHFSGDVALCMQVSQPDTVVKHLIHKIERIPGSKHRLRKSKYKSYKVPGKTFYLNQKNNEMCNKIFPINS